MDTSAHLIRRTARPSGRGTGAYEKGLRRRALLIDSARTLLETRTLDEVSLKDIAQEAGVPIGSAYHFFANAHAVYAALATRFTEELSDLIAAPYSRTEAKTWRTLFDTAVERAARLYADNPAYRQLIIGGKAPPEIKLADRQHDEEVGALMLEVISRHFELEPFPNCRNAFFYATEIVDLMFSLSVMRHDCITDSMLEEAKRAAGSYLESYLPALLPERAAG